MTDRTGRRHSRVPRISTFGSPQRNSSGAGRLARTVRSNWVAILPVPANQLARIGRWE
jgi:hypothetical protein